MTKREMAKEWQAIERQAMGPAKPPRKVEVGSPESAFDNPPKGEHTDDFDSWGESLSGQ